MAERATRERSRKDSSGRKDGTVRDDADQDDGSQSPLGEELERLVSALTGRAVTGISNRVGGLTDKLTGLAESPGGKAAAKVAEKKAQGKSTLGAGLAAGMHGLTSKISQAFGGGGGGSGSDGKKLKVTNIVEEIDIGAPVRVVYDQWTRFEEFSDFMKKVEHVDAEDPQGEDKQEITFKAQVLWSHRTWKARITEQVPDKRIVWTSTGEKGSVDGAVTFHEIAPELTRVLLVLEYKPQGLFERTGNLWRAQGRRVRLELKHFRRHVMTESMLHPDEIEGWRGEIHDGEVTTTHEDAAGEGPDDRADDRADEDELEDEDENDEDDDEPEDDDEDEDDDDEDEDDDDEDEDDEDDGEDDDEDEDDLADEDEDREDE